MSGRVNNSVAYLVTKDIERHDPRPGYVQNLRDTVMTERWKRCRNELYLRFIYALSLLQLSYYWNDTFPLTLKFNESLYTSPKIKSCLPLNSWRKDSVAMVTWWDVLRLSMYMMPPWAQFLIQKWIFVVTKVKEDILRMHGVLRHRQYSLWNFF